MKAVYKNITLNIIYAMVITWDIPDSVLGPTFLLGSGLRDKIILVRDWIDQVDLCRIEQNKVRS